MSDRPSLASLESAAPFSRRHIGPDRAEQESMLSSLGFETMDDLLYAALPDTIRSAKPLDLPAAMSEVEVRNALAALAARNRPRSPRRAARRSPWAGRTGRRPWSGS